MKPKMFSGDLSDLGKPLVSNQGYDLAFAFESHHRWVRKQEQIRGFYYANIQYGSRLYLCGQLVGLHLTQAALANKRVVEWYYFRQPEEKVSERLLFDRFNAIAVTANLPTLHKVAEFWIWKDGVRWTGQRTLRTLSGQESLRETLRRILTNPW